MYKFGKSSNTILNTVNKYLVLTATETIKISVIDISIPDWGGKRTDKEQNSYYKLDWSNADGYINISKHQILDEEGKALALDLCAWFKGKQNWNKERLVYINTLFGQTFNRLKKEGRIPSKYHLHQGMFFSRAKKGLIDAMGFDRPHNHLSSVPQISRIH